MNTYLLPIYESGHGCWIEKVNARSLMEANEKFVKCLADTYDEVDYGDTLDEAYESLSPNVVIGDIYDIEEFQ